MADEIFGRLLAWIETWGVWLSWLAWATVFLGALAMLRATRDLRSQRVRIAALVVAALAVVAHLADYVITLRRSPDLALELNPLWRNVLQRHGLEVARWYGLTGKLLVCVLAGQMTAFHLANRERLYPHAARSVPHFLWHMGERSRTWRERGLALFTTFAFFFAGLTFFYFYVAYQNSITDPAALDRLPSIPLAVSAYVLVLCVAFIALTYRAFRASAAAGDPGGGTSAGG